MDTAGARQNFFIERPQLGMHLSFEQEKESRHGPFVDAESLSTTYKEQLDIATRGWIYHPALVEYFLRLSPEWEQSRTTSTTDDTRTSDAFLSGYRAELNFLQFKPYSLRLFGERDMTDIRNNFAGRSTVETDLLGADLDLRFKTFNVSLISFQKETEKSGFFESSTDDRQTHITMNHNTKYSYTTTKGIYKDVRTQGSHSVIDTNSLSTSFNNRLFTSDTSLNSRFQYDKFNQSFSRQRRYSIDEVLDVRHSSTLSTGYNLHYQKHINIFKSLNEDNRSESKSAGFSLSHLLYENLSTSFSADIANEKFRTGRDTTFNTGIHWYYKRTIPWGMLNMNVGYSYLIRDNKIRSEADSTVLVQDESLVLTDGDITVLSNTNVIDNTIRITELESFNGYGIEYQEGIDYEVIFTDNRARIIRKAGGAIANGQTVFVEYRYIAAQAFDYSLFNQNYGIMTHLWSSWDLYYYLFRSNQKVLRGMPATDTAPLDDSIHRAGTAYTWKWSKTSLEWEDRYTVNSPYEKWKADETMTFRPRFNIFLTLSASYTETMFKDTSETEEVTKAGSNIQWQLSGTRFLTLQGTWTDTRGKEQSVSDTTFTARHQWRARIWNLDIEYSFDEERDRMHDDTFQNHRFLVELTRELF